MKKYLFWIVLLFFVVSSTGCENDNPVVPRPSSPVIILFDNDVHCAVDGYSRMSALKEQQKGITPYVTLLSCGDFAQGDIVGSVSQGEYIVDIMNQVGYDFITLGNHEFDYGMEQMKFLTGKLNSEVLCANFQDAKTGELLFKPYETVRYGNVDIAYIGVATPATSTSVSPKTFMDEQGNMQYSFLRQTLFECVQQQVDQARGFGADYVVILSHLGDEEDGINPTSIDLAANTTGIDVILDGHAHHIIPDSLLPNKSGGEVLLSSTGTKFENIGMLTLSVNGEFSSELLSVAELSEDAGVQNYVDGIKAQVLADGERVVGEGLCPLSIYDDNGNRIVRDREAPIGNFCADAFRYVLGTDIAAINGGGIRADIPAGAITYNTLLSVFPFNNTMCTVLITGEQLLDALEVSVMMLPEEDGSFMQVSGLKFSVDTSIPSPVVLDENNLFSHINGKRRVSGVKVLNKESGAFEEIDLNKSYTMGGISYNLKDLGSWGMFRYATLLQDNLGQDVDMLSIYLQDALGGIIGNKYATPDGRILF